MGHLLFLFWGAFVVGFSGAMMPGPVLTATISEVLKRGWRAGPLIVLGHALLEIVILVCVVAGLEKFLRRDVVIGILGLAGGAILVLMGIETGIDRHKVAQCSLQLEQFLGRPFAGKMHRSELNQPPLNLASRA